MRIGPATSGPLLCYTRHNFHTTILGVNKLVREEATCLLYEGNPCMLYMYLVFNGDIHCGSDVGGDLGAALETFSASRFFPHVHACIIDIRLFRSPGLEYGIPRSSTFGELRTSLKAIVGHVAHASALKAVEVSWCDYYDDQLQEEKRKSLQPLWNLPVMLKVSTKLVEKAETRSRADFSDWPSMLKPYRRLDFSQSSFDNTTSEDMQPTIFRPPHPSNIDMFRGEIITGDEWDA